MSDRRFGGWRVKTVCIIQARMGSTRLPGKVLLQLGSGTVLDHVLRRAQAVPGVSEVCCAIPDTPDCEAISAEAMRAGATIFRGSENDVLDRYYQAARATNADIILRATSDCPLLDPDVCGQVLALRARENADFATNNMPPSWPHGLDCEVVTFAWLERAALRADKKFEREHVMPFVRNHPEARKVNLVCPDERMYHLRWTLDNARDWAFFEALWPRLPDGPSAYGYETPLAVVAAEPSLTAINAGQDRLEGLTKSHRGSRHDGAHRTL